MKNIIYSLSIIAVFFYSCAKDENASGGWNHVWHIDKAVKEYALFKPGSYWVYQDSSTGILDSVYVYNYITGIDTVTSPHDPTNYFEYFDFWAMSALDGSYLHYWVNMSWTKAFGNTPVWFSRFASGNLGQTFLLVYPPKLGLQYGAYTENGI